MNLCLSWWNKMLTLQFVPYTEIQHLDSNGKIKKLLNIVKKNEIVLMEGRLKTVEEAQLIEQTMKDISPKFKGIEICTIYPEIKKLPLGGVIKRGLSQLLLGDKEGLTVIGPATIVKEIKRDPNKIQLYTGSRRKK